MADVSLSAAPATIDRQIADLRPKLHRYCARMAGSVIDGEDIVQDVLLKAIEAFGRGQVVVHLEGWLFRIAHNAALDFLRARGRREILLPTEALEPVADALSVTDQREITSTSLRLFMRLPVLPRSAVILMDVLGFENYTRHADRRLDVGFVDGRPALLVRIAEGPPAYVVLLEWAGEWITGIRDFAHARYAMDSAELDA